MKTHVLYRYSNKIILTVYLQIIKKLVFFTQFLSQLNFDNNDMCL